MSALGDSYRLMANTQILHWNVQGPLFFSIHNLTETQYQDFFTSVDDIAERIRALGMPAPRTMSEMVDVSTIGDIDGNASLESQIGELIEFNEKLAASMRDIVTVAEKANDVKTADLLTNRIGVLEQNAWMLRATIAATE
jgi:starvation-inducible DNA-binding protein